MFCNADHCNYVDIGSCAPVRHRYSDCTCVVKFEQGVVALSICAASNPLIPMIARHGSKGSFTV